MKHLFRSTLMGMFFCSTVALFAAPATPVAHISAPMATNPGIRHPHLRQIDKRLRAQYMLISKGVKEGKITQSQGSGLKASLKSVHQQAVSFFKANSDHELTADQQGQLNSLLDKNSQALGETPTTTN